MFELHGKEAIHCDYIVASAPATESERTEKVSGQLKDSIGPENPLGGLCVVLL